VVRFERELVVTFIDHWVDKGIVPEVVLRAGIRRLLAKRIEEIEAGGPERRRARQMDWIAQLRRSPLAIETQAANEQHYEVPPEFFERVLGAHLKYSSAYYLPGVTDLGQAEADMLALTCERAEVQDGQRILELGCGWGSLTLFLAERFPSARIVALSNSTPQRLHIEKRLAARKLENVEVVTCDVNAFATDRRFDRVVSVEMFEHLRNYAELFSRIRGWLVQEGKLFFHVFCHRDAAYPFETTGDDDWMGRYFFTGGQMPSDDLFLHFQDDLVIENRWGVDGTHYARTSEAWLRNLESGQRELMPVLAATYGEGAAASWYQRWRVFFLSCAELFGYRGGAEWYVAHYLFRPRAVRAA
jgi:cyclopropane-fatty-acyl-phospholipid synthase